MTLELCCVCLGHCVLLAVRPTCMHCDLLLVSSVTVRRCGSAVYGIAIQSVCLLLVSPSLTFDLCQNG